MPDYGHDLLFGTFLTPAAARADDVLRQARLTDEAGLDLVTIQDHPYQPAFLETWTLLSVIAGRTSRVRVTPNVANLPLRPPAVLARAAASLDILSGGRVELGLGAGAFWDPIAAMGGPRRTAGESVEALEEAIRVIRTLWTDDRAERIHGKHYQLSGAKTGPRPAHPIGIWLGAYGKRMLRLTGRTADGWLPSSPYAPPEKLAEMNGIIDAAARSAGREPGEIRRLYNLGGHFTAEQLAELALSQGISGFIMMADLDDDKAIQRFAEETAPAVREMVEQARGGGGGARPFRAGRERDLRPAGRDRDLRPAPADHDLRRAPADRDLRPAPAGHDHGLVPAPAGLGVTPTPHTGPAVTLWDEAARPSAPAPQADRVYPESGRARARHLVEIHDHLRAELAQVREIVRQVAEGAIDVGRARSEISRMTLRQNNWTAGAYCASYCRLVTMHHTAEDLMLFPQLKRLDPALAPVVDRLEQEHHVIAGVLESVDAGLVALVAEPERVPELLAAVGRLADTLLSHLSYEEHQLIEPLARLPLML